MDGPKLMNQFRLAVVAFLVVVAIFLVGRLTAPKAESNEQYKAAIDSLRRDAVKHEMALRKADRLIEHYKSQSDVWFSNYKELEKRKTVTRTIHDNEVKRIDSFTATQLDSAFARRYPE
jgi:hypothetical protein